MRDDLERNEFQYFEENFENLRPSTTKVEHGEPVWVWILILLLVLAAIAGVFIADRQAQNDERADDARQAAETTGPPTVYVVTNLPPPLTEAATTTATAARAPSQIQVTEPVPPPFDPVAYVNSLDYCWQCPAPAMEAYRVVATYYGWADWQINGRAEFVQRIMAGESAFCWNTIAWSYGTALEMPCEQIGIGKRDDAGFGQLTNVLRPLTCAMVAICTKAETVANPWNSMLSFVAVLTELEKRPWCYKDKYGRPNSHMRNGDCGTWPG